MRKLPHVPKQVGVMASNDDCGQELFEMEIAKKAKERDTGTLAKSVGESRREAMATLDGRISAGDCPLSATRQLDHSPLSAVTH
jgi:hypothetical protein